MLDHLHGREISYFFLNHYILSLFSMFQLTSVGSHPPTCQKILTTPALHPPIEQLKTAARSPFMPSHPTAEETQVPQPLLAQPVLQSPLTSSVPMYCVPVHQSIMLQILSSLPHQKRVLFATCLKQEELHLGVSLPLLSFGSWLCVHKHLQAICCKHKV